MEWRYCVRVTAQCGQERRDMVVFGDRLNAVFGAPAAELRRLIRDRNCLQINGEKKHG